jgi:hypothetical protein
MNERIKQLAEQAGYKKDMFGIGHWDMPECQKFAQLLIKECANVAANHDALDIYEEIREHFGVSND